MARAAHRHADMASFIEADRPCCGRRQIDVPTSDPWAAIINTNCDAPAMTDHNKRAERQGTMRGRKSRAIQALTVCGSPLRDSSSAAEMMQVGIALNAPTIDFISHSQRWTKGVAMRFPFAAQLGRLGAVGRIAARQFLIIRCL